MMSWSSQGLERAVDGSGTEAATQRNRKRQMLAKNETVSLNGQSVPSPVAYEQRCSCCIGPLSGCGQGQRVGVREALASACCSATPGASWKIGLCVSKVSLSRPW